MGDSSQSKIASIWGGSGLNFSPTITSVLLCAMAASCSGPRYLQGALFEGQISEKGRWVVRTVN